MRIAIMKEASIYREGLIGVLTKGFPRYEIITIEPNEHDKLNQYIIDILIIDIDNSENMMPIVNRYATQNKKVIIWTQNMEHENLDDLFKMNLHGYFYNGMEQDELIRAIQKIMTGRSYVHHELTPVLLGYYRASSNPQEKRPVGVLTNREWEVMELLTQGYSNERIGQHLYITEKTVKNHISSILRKLNVPDRTNAVLTALRNEWFFIS
ncbi:response regulator transcription factor [Gracilibacillus sp. YIM 98692]|uniref:response regulator transcription factor n=1 Tax=Gracilibacillus sp. YIM 98692 TaxID=2663532 RepID=UPI0013D4E374|nr:response regulator transcription factor [Gracilibacillus sp. YIM 98692]